MPDNTPSAVRGPTPEILISWPEGRPFLGGAEAVEDLGVFAHHEVRQQRNPLAGMRQVVERAHRHIDLVTDAVAVHHHLRRIAFGQRCRSVCLSWVPFFKSRNYLA